jgi:hypothetical protein
MRYRWKWPHSAGLRRDTIRRNLLSDMFDHAGTCCHNQIFSIGFGGPHANVPGAGGSYGSNSTGTAAASRKSIANGGRVVPDRLCYRASPPPHTANHTYQTKARDKRPGLDGMLKAAVRRKFDVVMAWSVDRLGRSLLDLIGSLEELADAKVNLFLLKQVGGICYRAMKQSFAGHQPMVPARRHDQGG